METQPLPIFECVVYEYNHDYASGEETDKPLWESIHTQYVQARNEHRAETVFMKALKDEQVYMPSIADQLVELKVCTYYDVLSDFDKERYPLIVDSELP